MHDIKPAVARGNADNYVSDSGVIARVERCALGLPSIGPDRLCRCFRKLRAQVRDHNSCAFCRHGDCACATDTRACTCYESNPAFKTRFHDFFPRISAECMGLRQAFQTLLILIALPVFHAEE
jgi:hypothetical protein